MHICGIGLYFSSERRRDGCSMLNLKQAKIFHINKAELFGEQEKSTYVMGSTKMIEPL